MTFSWCCIKASLCGSVGILLWAAVVVLVVISAVFITLRTWIRWRARSLLPHLRIPLPDGKAPIIAGFFHPYCNAGGGGERVLWVAVRALQKKYKHVHCVVYTGDTDASGTEIIQRARERFNLHLPRPVEFVFLHRRKWVEAAPYAYFTLLGQSLGSIVLGWEALTKCLPHVYIDTMGYAFTLPLFRYLGGCKVGCYVHYPTISTDMLQKVSDRTTAHNNREFITKSPLISHLKLIYYRLFACVYGLAGRQSMVILVNSSWTFGHILGLWQASERTHVVYPPCDTNEFLKLPLQDEASRRTHSIVSVAQFRPEKDHPLQLRAFRTFLSIQPEENKSHYKLVLVGSCRNDEDHKRVEDLKKLGEQLGITEHVQFKLNVSFSDLKKSINEATIGLHTMWNEHFGIGVVELMAGGPVVLAHDSGGPKLDIVVDYNKQQTGFLACDEESYAKAMDTIIKMSPKQRLDIRRNARESVIRFSEAEFETGFLDAMENIWET